MSGRAGLPEAAECPAGADAIYRVSYHDPENPAVERSPGWTLCAALGESVRWCADLAAHGAGPLAGPRQAKAVAVRALKDRGVAVDAWEIETDRPGPTYRAVHRGSEPPGPPGAGAP